MSPNRPVSVTRGRVVGSFVIMVALFAAILAWYDWRIDSNRESAVRALAKATAAQETNRLQNEIRRELVFAFCTEIESIKERIRASVRVTSRADYTAALRRLNPAISDEQVTALYLRAKMQEAEIVERFKPRRCSSLPGATG